MTHICHIELDDANLPPPSPESATVTCSRAPRETSHVGTVDGSASGSS